MAMSHSVMVNVTLKHGKDQLTVVQGSRASVPSLCQPHLPLVEPSLLGSQLQKQQIRENPFPRQPDRSSGELQGFMSSHYS